MVSHLRPVPCPAVPYVSLTLTMFPNNSKTIYEASQVLVCTSSYMPQPEDSGGHSHPCHFRMLHFGFGDVKTLANLNFHFEAVPTLRVYGYPYGLQDSLCTLHLDCSQYFNHSASDATLDTGGWLDLTGQGLAPCKVHQASLGALTFAVSGRMERCEACGI